MSAKVEPESFLSGHVTVRMRDLIVVFCPDMRDVKSEFIAHGVIKFKIPEVWTYNLWTEQWRKETNWTIQQSRQSLPVIADKCGIAIGSVIYMFGGGNIPSNDLWEVTQNTEGSFYWNNVCMTKKEMPSPRRGQSCWEYEGKMWIFGGYGESPVNYLNDHGDFVGKHGRNNQLLMLRSIHRDLEERCVFWRSTITS